MDELANFSLVLISYIHIFYFPNTSEPGRLIKICNIIAVENGLYNITVKDKSIKPL